MAREWRLIEELTWDDLKAHPVWEFVNEESNAPDTAVRPVDQLPVNDLAGRLVGTKVVLNNGRVCCALLSNISLQNPRRTKHFLCVGVRKHDRWFDLARYHDVDYAKRGPEAMAAFLGMPVDDVFPLKYDISAVAVGNEESVKGVVESEPHERLSEGELIELSLEE